MTVRGSPDRLEYAIRVLNKLREPLLWFIFKTYPAVRNLLALRGVEFLLIRRGQGVNDSMGPTIERLEELFCNALEIQFAVGEAGHRLMQDPRLLSGLRRAYCNNGALIEIVHGPRVDPLTTSIFDFAAEGMLTLFQMPEYAKHHFILVRDLKGDTTLIDEGIHNETVWKEDEDGNQEEVVASTSRSYYITSRANRVIDSRRRELQSRKAASSPTKEHPRISTHQDLNPFRYVLYALLALPVKHLLQPIASFLNLPVDSVFVGRYKDSGYMHERRLDKASNAGKEGGIHDRTYPSPYNEPDIIKGRYNEETGEYDLSFEYIGREPGVEVSGKPGVRAEMGVNSQRLFSLKVRVDDPHRDEIGNQVYPKLEQSIESLRAEEWCSSTNDVPLANQQNYELAADALRRAKRSIAMPRPRPFKINLLAD